MVAVGMPRSAEVLALVLVVLACGEHQLDLPDDDLEPASMPVCMLLVDTLGHWDEGESNIVWDVEAEQVGSVCTCMTEDELLSEALHDELNDRMLVECRRLSALIGFDWDECLEDYESGIWKGTTYRSQPDDYWSFLVPNDLRCE